MHGKIFDIHLINCLNNYLRLYKSQERKLKYFISELDAFSLECKRVNLIHCIALQN